MSRFTYCPRCGGKFTGSGIPVHGYCADWSPSRPRILSDGSDPDSAPAPPRLEPARSA